jgi:hypothetical protein
MRAGQSRHVSDVEASVRVTLHHVPSRVRKTIPEHHREQVGKNPRQRIAPLDRRAQGRATPPAPEVARPWRRGTRTLEDDDVLALSTDGVVESGPSVDEAVGWTRALDVIDAHRREPARRIVQHLHDASRTFSGSPPADDVTVVICPVGDREDQPTACGVRDGLRTSDVLE